MKQVREIKPYSFTYVKNLKNNNKNTTSYTENELVIARGGDRAWRGGETRKAKRNTLPAVSHGDMMCTQHGGCS